MAAYRWALSWSGLSSPEKFVLVVIADHYNESAHRSWPSIERLARYTALGRSTVKRAIKRLEEEGLLEVEPWRRADTEQALNNRYCLPLFDPESIRSATLPVRFVSSRQSAGKGSRLAEHSKFGDDVRTPTPVAA